MDFDSQFNLIDLVVFILILFSLIGGIRQGFLGGLMDLVGLVAAIYLAFKGYHPVGGLVMNWLPLPRGVANIGAFIGLFVICQVLFSIVFGTLTRGLRRLLLLFPPLRVVNSLAGVIPGAVKGLVGVTLLLLPFGLFPIVPQVNGEIKESFFGSRAISLASDFAPRLESLFGQAAEDTLVLLSQPDADKPLEFGSLIPSELTVDGASEQRMLDMVNAERAKADLDPLIMDAKLQQAARGHSEEMFRLSYFAHDSPVAGNPYDRMRGEGARFTLAAENLAYAPNVEMAHSGLMNSPGHRKNILTPGLRRIGIGVIDGGIRGKMFTQNFTD